MPALSAFQLGIDPAVEIVRNGIASLPEMSKHPVTSHCRSQLRAGLAPPLSRWVWSLELYHKKIPGSFHHRVFYTLYLSTLYQITSHT